MASRTSKAQLSRLINTPPHRWALMIFLFDISFKQKQKKTCAKRRTTNQLLSRVEIWSFMYFGVNNANNIPNGTSWRSGSEGALIIEKKEERMRAGSLSYFNARHAESCSRWNWQLSRSLCPIIYSSYFDPGITHGIAGMPRILFNVNNVCKVIEVHRGAVNLRGDTEDN